MKPTQKQKTLITFGIISLCAAPILAFVTSSPLASLFCFQGGAMTSNICVSYAGLLAGALVFIILVLIGLTLILMATLKKSR